RFVEAACAAAEFVWTRLRAGGKLLHGWAGGRAKHGAYLDDHAFLASALLDLYEATGDRVHLERARELVAALDARFHDDAGGGYFFTAHDEEQLIARSKPGADGGRAGDAIRLPQLRRLGARHPSGRARPSAAAGGLGSRPTRPGTPGDAARAARPGLRARPRCPVRGGRAPPGPPADRLAAP